jgi:hypothetical protein
VITVGTAITGCPPYRPGPALISKVALDLFAVAALHLEDRGEEAMYVNIPFTKDTLPNAEEQAACLASLRMTPS